jgi:hypothetical protein
MPATAVLEASQTKLLYQQTALCKGRITNHDRSPLASLNPTTVAAAPTIVVTNVQTGAQSRHARLLGKEQHTPPVALAPGATREYPFSLTQEVLFPGPGAYDVQLHYEWSTGETLSPPTRFELAPNNPQTLDLVTSKGGPAPLQHIAFLHRPDPRDTGGELWLAQLFLAGRPAVQDCVRLESIKQPLIARQSVPPNIDCSFHWTGWIQGNELRLVLRRHRDLSAPVIVPLDAADYRIVPPLLVNVAKNGDPEGVDVLLFRPNGAGGRLVGKRILLAGKPAGDVTGTLPGLPPSWGQTVYQTNRRRHTFFLGVEQGKQVLKHLPWPTLSGPPLNVKAVAGWPSPFGVGCATLTESDTIAGAVLVNAGDPAENQYKFVTWAVNGDQFALDREIPVAWPDARRGLDMAILRVGTSGRPFALLRAARDQVWHWCGPDGAVRPLTGPAAQLQLPADIAFRGGDDPAIVFAEPGRGFQFAKPG